MFGDGSRSKQEEQKDYEAFRLFLEKSCGIILGDDKHYLVQSRLKKLFKDKEISNLQALIREIENKPFSPLKQATIDAMTTNETLWFRDRHPFEYLVSTLFKERAKVSGKDIRIWSAACSYGQEPYSLSMCADEARKSGQLPIGSDVKIVATDISKSALDKAKRGHYESLALGRGLSPERLKFNFKDLGDGEWELNSRIKGKVDFRILNLQDRYNSMGKLDIIFCRNVLIYFSAEFKSDILTRMHACLKPNGYLFLGASEALPGLTDKFEMVPTKPGIVYRAK
ncbi:MAG: protein-glutamate O-methyltransferase CheR [Pseudomonadales bacterium]|nr:protein-glutamate O-methyltransferase CheR [Pseudomonadales bacterium]